MGDQMFGWVLLAAIAISPGRPVLLTDRVDVVEINHVHDFDGRPTIDQLIFWRWSPDASEFEVIDWRLLKTPLQRPLRRFGSDDRFWSVWTDPAGAQMRQVWAGSVRETWTLYDPEVRARKQLSQKDRRKLRQGGNGPASRIR